MSSKTIKRRKALIDPEVQGGILKKIDETRAPLTAYLGVLGLTSGMTSYFGVREVGAVAQGDTGAG